MRSDLERLRDIEQAIANISKYSVRGKDNFLAHELVQTWVLFHLQRIGVAAKAMSVNTRNEQILINWQDIIEFGDLGVDKDFRANLDIVWQIVEHQIENLRVQIQDMIEKLDCG
jgi:uncharacterized protein with HEPN domain